MHEALRELRTSVYVDGFNLFYGCLKGTPYKWLDLKSLVSKLLAENHTIVEIKYFTAIVSGKLNPEQPIRQQTYIRALQGFIPEFSVYYGHFLTHNVDLPLASPSRKRRYAEVLKTEEKGSDVNLAIHLLNDAWRNRYDCAVVISNDSDLATALRYARYDREKTIGLIYPGAHGHPSAELQKHAHFVKRIRPGVLRSSQLPSQIPGTNITKPDVW